LFAFYRPVSQISSSCCTLLLLHNDKWLKKISAKFQEVWKQCSVFIFDIMYLDISSNCRHFNGSPLLCPINATSSFSYVFSQFRLQYPRVLHCRIVLTEKLTTLVALGREKPPVYHLGSK
jgi:hypothetical protein